MFPLKDTQAAKIFPFWVTVIIALNIYVFSQELISPNADALITHYALVPALVDFSRPSTLFPFVSSQFLHGGFLHIISNMWFLWVFGKNMEGRTGLLFPFFYVVAGAAGNFLQYLLSPTSMIPILGASGAIAGVLGAYYALFPEHKIKTFIFVLFFASIIEIPVSFMLFYWFITQLFNTAVAVSPAAASDLGGGVAYFAHVGGFGVGWLVGRILKH
ncbi:hypothetical protein A3E45_00775 [Candidatus Daviesbacteria bacterium RIFCSPHIGHO2_12_FULL_43_11]|uniref:Peptidase S54 rhomboid domain-containing protein n=2 Tax=Candidatus Daviesiibacteriota TaxID=1752718 RepID=A0A1F5K6K4_9BACT|nr:MAG: Rhomboid family protein [Candidatus Daviesbacteria bacterium GW2011_GWA2_42_7]OGE36438.1 MAG: hypothetical protein A3E45_00775 [Candidatus Daviesbacteria bacterium RIFCSPHIGHO2_12_FULL_43_11]